MTYINTQYKRSLKLSVTKTSNEVIPIVTNIVEDGRSLFVSNGVTYQPIIDDDVFAKLTINGVDGEWDVRKNAFIAYINNKYILEPELTTSINWTKTRIFLPTITIQLLQVPGESSGVVYAKALNLTSMPDIVTIVSTDGTNNYTFVVAAYNGMSVGQALIAPSIVDNLSIVSVTPEYSASTHYIATGGPVV